MNFIFTLYTTLSKCYNQRCF